MSVRLAPLVLMLATMSNADPLVSTVNVKLEVPHAPNAAGVRVWLSGTAAWPNLNEHAKTDADGRAVLHTRRTEFQYVVARRRDCDIALLGDRKNLAIAGDWLRFQRGRLDLSQPGVTLAPDLVLGASDEQPLALRKKTPGKAKFVFIAQDSLALRRSFDPSQSTPAGKVFVTGSWNAFSTWLPDADNQPADAAIELFDDGSLVEDSGDECPSDGVFTRVVDLPPGEHHYVFLANGVSGGGGAFLTDPYEEGHTTRWITTPFCAPGPGFPPTITTPRHVSTIRVTARDE